MNASMVVLKGMAWGLSTAGALLIGLVALVIAGPQAETVLFPVITDVSWSYRGIANGQMRFDYSATKTRACELLDLTALVEVESTVRPGTKEWVKADVQQDGRSPRMVNRPTGRQSFGLFEFLPVGSRVQIQTRHRCHPFWVTTTVFPEFSAARI